MTAALAAALVYLPSLANELVWDDRLDILANRRVQNLGDAFGYFGQLQGIYYRPLVFLSFAVDYALWGEHAWGYHLTNLVLHAANAFLLVATVLRSAPSSSDRGTGAAGDIRTTALLAGLLFALHPLQSDAIAYVSGRTDVLMTTGALAVWCAVQSKRATPMRGGIAAGGAAVAILSKESGFAVAPLLVWWVYRHERTAMARLLIVVPTLLITILLLGIRLAVSDSLTGIPLSFTGSVAVGRALWTYIALLAWPVDLQIDRLTASTGSLLGNAAAVALAISVALVAAWGLTRRARSADWVAWSVAFYLPVANAVPLYSAISERWLFTPEHNMYATVAGLAVLVATAIERYGRQPTVRTVAIVGLAAWAIVTVRRQQDWHDEARLFASAVGAGSQSPRVWYNYGNGLARSADWRGAAEAYRTALRLSPNDVDMWSNLGVVLQREGQIDAAIEAYAKAATLAPPSAQLLENLGTAHLRRGDVNAARASFMRALELDPQRQIARRALAALTETSRKHERGDSTKPDF